MEKKQSVKYRRGHSALYGAGTDRIFMKGERNLNVKDKKITLILDFVMLTVGAVIDPDIYPPTEQYLEAMLDNRFLFGH